MEREQIIKALECCQKDDCDNCPNDFGNCYSNLAKDALSLIKELTEENEKLLTALANYDRQTDVRIAEEYYTVEAYEELREENERLRAEVSVKKKLLDKCVDLEDRVRADTVRKMQERLKKAFNFGHTILEKSICDIIDHIAKEMLEGKNDG